MIPSDKRLNIALGSLKKKKKVDVLKCLREDQGLLGFIHIFSREVCTHRRQKTRNLTELVSTNIFRSWVLHLVIQEGEETDNRAPQKLELETGFQLITLWVRSWALKMSENNAGPEEVMCSHFNLECTKTWEIKALQEIKQPKPQLYFIQCKS